MFNNFQPDLYYLSLLELTTGWLHYYLPFFCRKQGGDDYEEMEETNIKLTALHNPCFPSTGSVPDPNKRNSLPYLGLSIYGQ